MNIEEFHSEAFQNFVLGHLQEDPALLLLKYNGKVDFDLKAAVQQISARQKAKKKLPEWTNNKNLIFPVSLSLQQSSSEQTAKFKSREISGDRFIDLTGGFGVDCFYLSQNFESGIYCERNSELASIAKHNLSLLSKDGIKVIHGDGLEILNKASDAFDLVFIDPARRGDSNQKLYKLADCEPDVVNNWKLIKGKAKCILIKASPMLDISQALNEVSDIQKITILSVKNEVKEVLLQRDSSNDSKEVLIEAIDLGSEEKSFSFTFSEERQAQSIFSESKDFLIEPLSSILKAGALKTFGQKFDLYKLGPNSHLFTSDQVDQEIPGRIFQILKEVKPSKSELKKLIPSGKVNVITRNYSMSANLLKKKFRLNDGGEDYLIGTKTPSGFKLFFCKRVRA